MTLGGIGCLTMTKTACENKRDSFAEIDAWCIYTNFTNAVALR